MTVTEIVRSHIRFAVKITNVNALMDFEKMKPDFVSPKVLLISFQFLICDCCYLLLFKELSCPNFVIGDNLVEQTVGPRCVVSYQLSEPGIHHNCSENEFCYTHVKSKPAETGSLTFVGHCCPKPAKNAEISLICPMTVGYNGTCPDLSRFPADMAVPPEFQSTCPRTTHDCVSVDSSIRLALFCFSKYFIYYKLKL